MAIIAKNTGGGKAFVPCPSGLHQAVCCDVVDNGIVQTQWGDKHKITIRWQASEAMEDGKPYLIQKRYTNSLHEKAALRHDLESWRGKPFTEAELTGFDLEKLLNANGQIVVVHRQSDDGKTWANVQALTPIGKGMSKIGVRDYVREVDRQPVDEGPGDSDFTDDVPADEIPF
uniref:Uncharacterized protein n=1 Tax=viral metagenome TaxID=1070528 RepID=A0A6M3JXF7_9ZZZZ